MALTAADIMTREVIAVTPATPVAEFARLCAEDRISGAPVVTVDGRLVGVVSRTDLLPALLESGAGSPGEGGGAEGFGGDDDDFDGLPDPEGESVAERMGTVDEIMQTDPVTVPPAMPVADVARRMAKERIHRVLVTEKGRILGIITSLDLLGHFPGGPKGRPVPKPKPKPKRK